MSKPGTKYGSKWSREEVVLTLYLYCQIPFGRCTQRAKEVQEFASILGRTPASVARKLGNLGRFDPKLAARGVSGLTHGSKVEAEVWDEFHDNWEGLVEEAERLLKGAAQHVSPETDILRIPQTESTESEGVAKRRIGQDFFRRAVLSSYDFRCCITGLAIPELLVASHIVPWAQASKSRLNPCNGLCLNMLHDKAFDRGLISFTDDLELLVHTRIHEHYANGAVAANFAAYEGKAIAPPARFMPDAGFVRRHRELWGF